MLYTAIFNRIPGTAIAQHRKILITSPGIVSLSCLLFDSLKKEKKKKGKMHIFEQNVTVIVERKADGWEWKKKILKKNPDLI